MGHRRAPRFAKVLRNVKDRDMAFIVPAERIELFLGHNKRNLGMDIRRTVGQHPVFLYVHHAPLAVDFSGIGNEYRRCIGKSV